MLFCLHYFERKSHWFTIIMMEAKSNAKVNYQFTKTQGGLLWINHSLRKVNGKSEVLFFSP